MTNDCKFDDIFNSILYVLNTNMQWMVVSYHFLSLLIEKGLVYYANLKDCCNNVLDYISTYCLLLSV